MDLVRMFNESGVFAKITLLMGVFPFIVAVAYVRRPDERKLALMRPTSLSSVFAGIAGVSVGYIVVLQGLALSQPDAGMRAVYLGMSEALGPLFVNFGFLAASWLLVAAGMVRRTVIGDR